MIPVSKNTDYIEIVHMHNSRNNCMNSNLHNLIILNIIEKDDIFTIWLILYHKMQMEKSIYV